jgi:DNA polymerase-1
MPVSAVLLRMERHGIRLDLPFLRGLKTRFAAELARLETRIHELAGEPFNIQSPKQLSVILFEKLGLKPIKKTATGWSTDASVLEQLADDHDLPAAILEYREVAKLQSTYVETLPGLANPDTGLIHTSYNQAVAATGRLSSSDPNLQNIPVRTAEGRRIRQAFIAPAGHCILAADYSQIELRIMAHLSGDAGLCQAFAAGLDIHSATAAEVFGVALDAVTAEQRRSAKAINFGLIYGMSAFGLGRQLSLGRNQAQEYIDRYFERYPGVRAYMDSTRATAAEQGYVETLYGRRLYVPEIRDRNAQRRQAAERAAINAPLQGTAADIIKRAMIVVDAWLTDQDLGARIIMQVHDELVLEVPEAELDTLRSGITSLMAGAAELAVPLVVDVGVGANWDEAH